MDTKNSIFGLFCLFMTSWMLMSATLYNFEIINSLTPLLKIMYNSTYQNTYHVSMSSNTWTLLLSVTASSIYIGAIIGGFGTNYLLNVLSRRSTMQLTHIIHIIGVLVISVCGGFTWSFGAIFIGRLITGISLGISYNLPTLVVAELSSRGSQGFWESLVGVSGLFGLFVAVVFGNPKVMGNMELWPYLVSLSIIPSIIYLIVNVTKEMEAIKDEMKQVKAVTIVEMVTTKSYRWSAGTNPSIFALLAAITTEPTRPTAFGYAALLFWVSDCSVGVGFPFLQKYVEAYSLTPWLACSVVFLFFSIFFIPETKNKSVKEIQAKFGRSADEENKPLLNK